nr:putative late blight resistance protein homolog R1B-16 isoform X1 [Ipomoea batatas]
MAYAAVTSLMGTMHLHFLQSQPRLPLKDNQEIVNSLYENLDFLQESLEKSEICYDNAGAMKDLEAEMRDVLFKAEERIEMELSTIYLQSSSIEACSLLRLHGIFNQALKQTDYLKMKIISEEQLAKEPCRWISYTPGSSFLWLDNQIRSNWLNKSHSIHSSALHFRDMKHLFSHFKLLRVLDIEIVFGEGHGNALNVLANLVHLRYLALSTSEDAFSFDVKLFEHWNMQSFIVRSCAGILDCSQASQIWKMSLLRNFYVRACFSLETSELGQLEKLSIRGWHPKGILCNGIPWETNFLPTLKKLIFKGTGLPWCDMRFIGMLPNLEVLKLINACERIQDEQHSYRNHALLGPEPTMLYNEGWYEAWIMMADFRNAEKPLNLVEAHGWWTFLNLHRKTQMAYAAVTSLKGTLYIHFLQSQPRLPLKCKQEIVNSLHENLGFFQEFLEKSEIAYGYDNSAMKRLEAEMRHVAFKAEEMIEMELSNIYLAKGLTKRIRIKASLLRLRGIFNEAVKQTDYLKKELIKISEKKLAKGPSQDEMMRRRGPLLDGFYNFVHLGQLEKLSIKRWDLKLHSSIPWATSFLLNLKKLKFSETKLQWSELKLIGMLSNLKVLKLIHACEGKEWEPCEGGFRQLKRLVIESWTLEDWNAVGDHFPVLQHLELNYCLTLREIPIAFADITTLELIQLKYCLYSVLTSAKHIQDEQRSYGNDALLLRFTFLAI